MAYSLQEYLRQSPYQTLPGEFTSFEAIFEAVAPTERPHVIAIDGPTTAGKTSFTAALAEFYRHRDIPVATMTLDSLLIARDMRKPVLEAVTSGALDIANYSDATRDQPAFRRYLSAARRLLTHAAEPGEVIIPHAYNRLTGRNDKEMRISVPMGGVLLAEGIGLHTHFMDLIDTAVRLDVHDDAGLVERIWQRERQKPAKAPQLEDDFLAWRYDHVDGPHAVYHREASAGRADIVVDTSDFAEMFVYTKQQ